MRAHPDQDAEHRNRPPQAEHRAPIKQPGDAEADARFRSALATASARLRLGLARRFVVGIVGFTLDGWLGRLLGLVVGNRDAVLRAKAQVAQRRGEPELRL